MTKKNAVNSLKESIRLLEIRQAEERVILIEHLQVTLESMKPVNILKSYLKDLTGSTELKNNFFGTFISIVSGYITKKMVAGPKSNPFIKILGSILQFGVTSVIAKNAESIWDFLDNLFDRFFHSEENEVSEIES
jgi:hypothetical protein